MLHTTRDLESAVWASAEGRATPEERSLLQSDPRIWLRVVGRLIAETEEHLASARKLELPARDWAVADLEDDLTRLWTQRTMLSGELPPEPEPEPAPAPAPAPKSAGVTVAPAPPPPVVVLEPLPVVLQASWAAGQVVVWAGGRGNPPADNDELADRLEAVGAPAHGWETHAPIELPTGRAAALSIPLAGSLGWLIAAAAGPTDGGTDAAGELGGVGVSVTWMGRVALAGVRLVARGCIVPTLHKGRRVAGASETRVQWLPAAVDDAELDALASAMPHTVLAVQRDEPRSVVNALIAAVVESVVTQAASRLDLPAPPPRVVSAADVAESFVTRLNGSWFPATPLLVSDLARRLERWNRSVTASRRPRLVLQLDSPDQGGAWFLSVLAPNDKGKLVPVEQAMADPKSGRVAGDELTRLERLLPVLGRPGGRRRGQVVLSQDEAWDLMTVHAAEVECAGFGVRLPALSRRKPTGTLRLFVEPTGDTMVGAHQLANVRWSVVFGDVELSASEVARLALEARPLIRSGGRWVELDRVDLKEAAAALAERANRTRMTGAEVLRHGIGLEGSPLGNGVLVEGSGWATDLLARSRDVSTEPVLQPEGFRGELRSYQAQALGWLRFLEATGLGGCLALDMGLGKTPTVLAHLVSALNAAKDAGAPDDPALVVAPPAVVGNWAAEARRFAPSLRVLVHHGALRAEEDELADQVRGYDLVITTYGTAVRDVDALAGLQWSRIVLDEAQAIKNPANETAQQLRKLRSPMRLALTGTPVENGVGDLWAILDFANPGLLGTRSAFIGQMAGEGESALRALNGILVFRRTKAEPEVAAELPDKIDELDHCTMTAEQIGMYQAVLDGLVRDASEVGGERKQGAILAAITALKQICNHPSAYADDGRPLHGRSGKLARLEEIVGQVFAADERILIFTHFAEWGRKLAKHLTEVFGKRIECYDGSLARGARDTIVDEFQKGTGAGALVLSLKAGGTGLNLTAASHVVLYDRWWNPAVEDQARDRAWRIGQTRTVVSHRLVCPGTVDERVEEVVAGKRHIADVVLPKSSSLADLSTDELRKALGLRSDLLLKEDDQ